MTNAEKMKTTKTEFMQHLADEISRTCRQITATETHTHMTEEAKKKWLTKLNTEYITLTCLQDFATKTD